MNDDIIEFMMNFMFKFSIIILFLCFIFGIPAVCYIFLTAEAPSSFSLQKNEWECAEFKKESYTTHNLVGKVMIPMTHTRSKCINWVSK